MKTIYTITQDMKKTVFSFGFWACVVLTFLLCFTSAVYTDWTTGKQYSAFEAAFTLDMDFMKRHSDFFWYNIFSGCIGQYLSMLLPIITAFPFIPNFCSERNSGLIRYTISRTGKLRYCFSKFFTALLCGGIAVLLGTLLFGGFCYLRFLKADDFKELIAIGEVLPEQFEISLLSVRRNCLGTFLFGMVSAVPAFLLSAFIKNRYIITCIPFMAMYMYSTFIHKLYADKEYDWEFYTRNFHLFHDSLLNYWNAGDYLYRLVIFNASAVVLSFVVFCIVMYKKTDVGQ